MTSRVFYADRRFVRLLRRLLRHEALDAYEAVIPISRLVDVLHSPLPHDIHG